MLCTSLLLFNFQGSSVPALRGDLVIIPLSLPFVKSFFKTFLSFFRARLRARPQYFAAPFGQLVYYTTFLLFCQGIFLIFSHFG